VILQKKDKEKNLNTAPILNGLESAV